MKETPRGCRNRERIIRADRGGSTGFPEKVISARDTGVKGVRQEDLVCVLGWGSWHGDVCCRQS